MNMLRNKILAKAVLVGCLLAPWGVNAHNSVDPMHATPVETVESSMARPFGIHVKITNQGVEVKGKIKRKGHKNISIRGHIDVELVGANGQVLQSKKVSISPRTGSVKHGHDRSFSVVLFVTERAKVQRTSHPQRGWS